MTYQCDKSGFLETGLFFQLAFPSKRWLVDPFCQRAELAERCKEPTLPFIPEVNRNVHRCNGNGCRWTYGCTSGPVLTLEPFYDVAFNGGDTPEGIRFRRTNFFTPPFVVFREAFHELFRQPLFGISTSSVFCFSQVDGEPMAELVSLNATNYNVLTRPVDLADGGLCHKCRSKLDLCPACGWPMGGCPSCESRQVFFSDIVVDGTKWNGGDLLYHGSHGYALSRKMLSAIARVGMGPLAVRNAYVRTDEMTPLHRRHLMELMKFDLDLDDCENITLLD